jgi:uncharacterized damage-inducible protein DinB
MTSDDRNKERSVLLAWLAAERAELLWQLVGWDERELIGSPVSDEWTAKDLLAHVAAWDQLFTARIELILTGKMADIVSLDLDAHNATLYAERKDWSLEQALQAALQARSIFLAALAQVDDDAFERPHHLPWGEATVRQWTEWRAKHDRAHATDLAAWRKDRGFEGQAGPKAVLEAVLVSARDELLVAVALIPGEERSSRLVCGEWTLKDVIAHITDWEQVGTEGLVLMAAGQDPELEGAGDIQAWNQMHYEARRDQPWNEVWRDLNRAYEAFAKALAGIGQAEMERSFRFPWGAVGTPYEWATVFAGHDREHATEIRESTIGDSWGLGDSG